jgi:hypothetical protein
MVLCVGRKYGPYSCTDLALSIVLEESTGGSAGDCDAACTDSAAKSTVQTIADITWLILISKIPLLLLQLCDVGKSSRRSISRLIFLVCIDIVMGFLRSGLLFQIQRLQSTTNVDIEQPP